MSGWGGCFGDPEADPVDSGWDAVAFAQSQEEGGPQPEMPASTGVAAGTLVAQEWFFASQDDCDSLVHPSQEVAAPRRSAR